MSKSSKKKKNAKLDSRTNKSSGVTNESASELRPVEASSARETIESVVIAFVLAFLFRTFAAEAFVIPTGSMAHTLRGAHKDVDCPECGYRYQFGASTETSLGENGKEPSYENDVISGTCPICRFTLLTDPHPTKEELAEPEFQRGLEYSTYNGDRIIVSKFDYVLNEPERWDVIVFKFPGEANTNYIKRLIGLPGETVSLRNGDLYINRDDEPPKIEPKPPEKALVLRQLVSDNHLQPKKLTQAGWPYRWSVWDAEGASDNSPWNVELKEDELNRWQEFSIEPKSSNAAPSEVEWIRYQHILPDFGDWDHIIRGGSLTDQEIEELSPQLITDFYSYNTGVERRRADGLGFSPGVRQAGLHWVGDLAIECDVEIQSETGQILVDLVEAGRHFTANIDIASGEATLSAQGADQFKPRGQTPVKGIGEYLINFANVDDRLLLWVDGKLVSFDQDTQYDPESVFGDIYEQTGNLVPESNGRDGDLSPAGVGSQGAQLNVRGLRIYRDVYYVADRYNRVDRPNSVGQTNEYRNSQSLWEENTPRSVASFFSDPRAWPILADRNQETFDPLKENQFFVLGDNSPSSLDGRLWWEKTNNKHYVDRKLLIGKALFIYWPHSWGEWPVASRWLPGWPAFGDMKLVR